MKTTIFVRWLSVVILSNGLVGGIMCAAMHQKAALPLKKRVQFNETVCTDQNTQEPLRDICSADASGRSKCGEEIRENVAGVYARLEQGVFLRYALSARKLGEVVLPPRALKTHITAQGKEELQAVMRSNQELEQVTDGENPFVGDQEYALLKERGWVTTYMPVGLSVVDSAVRRAHVSHKALKKDVQNLHDALRQQAIVRPYGRTQLLMSSVLSLEEVLNSTFFTQVLVDNDTTKETDNKQYKKLIDSMREKMYSQHLTLTATPLDAAHATMGPVAFNELVGKQCVAKVSREIRVETSNNDVLYDKVARGEPLALYDVWNTRTKKHVEYGFGWSWSLLFSDKGLMHEIHRNITNALHAYDKGNRGRLDCDEKAAMITRDYAVLRKSLRSASTGKCCGRRFDVFFKKTGKLVRSITRDVQKSTIEGFPKATVEEK